MVINQINRVMRQLIAAEGYLELQLPVDALDELQKVESPGPFEGRYMWLTGQALRYQGLYDEAIAPLRHAARALPDENGRQAWEALKECLEKSGRSATAEDMTRTMAYLDEHELVPTQHVDRGSPNVRIELPNFGKLQISFDNNDGLTIQLSPSEDTPT